MDEELHVTTGDGTPVPLDRCPECLALTTAGDRAAHKDWHSRSRVGAIVQDGQPGITASP